MGIKKIKPIILGPIILCFMVLGCIDQIELISPLTSNPILIIDGKLVKTDNSYSILVKTLISATSKEASKPVKAKEVLVINDKGKQALLTDLFNGSWIMMDNPSYPIEIGSKYKIRVTSFDNEIFESAYMQLSYTPPIKELSFDWQPTQTGKGVLDALIKTDVGDEESSKIFKWDIIEAYKYTDQILGQEPGKLCYVTNKTDRLDIALFDGRSKRLNEEFTFLTTTRPVNFKFSEGYYLTVVQETIDQSTFEYFNAYNNLVSRDGNIYEAPAGRIPSNIKNINPEGKLALGFFYAVNQDTSRVFIQPSDVGNPLRECPSEPTETSICGVRSCCDCLRLNGSSLNKPHFWN